MCSDTRGCRYLSICGSLPCHSHPPNLLWERTSDRNRKLSAEDKRDVRPVTHGRSLYAGRVHKCLAGYSPCAGCCSSLLPSLETDTVLDSIGAMPSLPQVCSTDVPVTGWSRGKKLVVTPAPPRRISSSCQCTALSGLLDALSLMLRLR